MDRLPPRQASPSTRRPASKPVDLTRTNPNKPHYQYYDRPSDEISLNRTKPKPPQPAHNNSLRHCYKGTYNSKSPIRHVFRINQDHLTKNPTRRKSSPAIMHAKRAAKSPQLRSPTAKTTALQFPGRPAVEVHLPSAPKHQIVPEPMFVVGFHQPAEYSLCICYAKDEPINQSSPPKGRKLLYNNTLQNIPCTDTFIGIPTSCVKRPSPTILSVRKIPQPLGHALRRFVPL